MSLQSKKSTESLKGKSNKKIMILFFILYAVIGMYIALWALSFDLVGVVFRLSQYGISVPLVFINNLSNAETLLIGLVLWSFADALAIPLCIFEKKLFSSMKSTVLLCLFVFLHIMSCSLFLEVNKNDFDCWFHAVLGIIRFSLFIYFISNQIKLIRKI